MRVRSLVLLVLIDLAVALAFASAWGLKWQTCAPPSPNCRTGACIALCVNAWSQFPGNLVFGALLGLIPAAAAGVGLWCLERFGQTRTRRVGFLVLSAATIAAAMGPILFYLGP